MPVGAAIGIVIGLFFLLPIISVLFGFFAGWVVSLFFNDTVHGVITGIVPGLKDFSLAQIGAGLGFLGSFFRSTASFSGKSD